MDRMIRRGKLTYIFYKDRASLLAILEFRIEVYFLAKYALPERAESLYTPEDVVQGIPLPMRYPFLPL
jgi:hypothetical protein